MITLELPIFTPGIYGNWELRKYENIACQSSSGVKIVPIFYSLRRNGVVWMSNAPSEIESQIKPCSEAYGNALVAGFGMGIAAYNMLLNSNVNSVTVIEKDSEIIKLFTEWDAVRFSVNKSFKFVNADIFEWEPDFYVDFFYADIWPDLKTDRRADVEILQKKIGAKSVYYWGQ